MKPVYCLIALGLLAGCNINQFLDPAYARQRFDLMVAGLEQDKPLACVTSQDTFWVRGGDWIEIGTTEDGVDYAIVVDSKGNKRIIYSDVANPNCTPKE